MEGIYERNIEGISEKSNTNNGPTRFDANAIRDLDYISGRYPWDSGND